MSFQAYLAAIEEKTGTSPPTSSRSRTSAATATRP